MSSVAHSRVSAPLELTTMEKATAYVLTTASSPPLLMTGATANHSRYDELYSMPAYTLLQSLNRYYTPVIIAVGVFGNLLSFVVFIFTYLNTRSSSYYLAALALADTLYLLTLLMVWITDMGVNIYHNNGWCQLLIYSSSVCSFLSVWFIVAFTVERFIAVRYPLHRPSMCTVSRAKMVIAALTVSGMVMYSYVMWTAGMVDIENGSGLTACGLLPVHAYAQSALNHVDTFLTLILPFVTVLVLNVLITIQIVHFNRKCVELEPKFAQQHTNIVSSRTHISIAKLLLLISTIFILLNTPSYVIRIHVFVRTLAGGDDDDVGDVMSTTEMLLQSYFNLLYYTNFSVNFVLYSVCGINFRRALVRLLREKLGAAEYTKNTHRYK
ncbi:PREDICTED: neuropeptides capa receptor-like [Priapulus caudatus]|uniref:Neuropeptides capa receptor-like n=1 Tax=Priapulus caudatus TaxID=37621 RepID=A0ABM1E1X4_PRICU|nr:PREDICTED: neuropeptides capa receptor-like [Priapulus caudatus]